jgi:hypothetical protein
MRRRGRGRMRNAFEKAKELLAMMASFLPLRGVGV